MADKIFVDRFGNRPLSGVVIKQLIEGQDFIVAWWTVCTYIMQMDLTPFHTDLMKFQYLNKRSLAMAGRGFGKSYTLDTAFTLTCILRDHNIRIAIATQSLSQAKKFVNELKNYFGEGTVIWDIWGDLRGNTWQETQFSLKRDKVIKEATVTAGSMGASANFISSHFDILMLDDIVGEENSFSKGQRDKLKSFVFNTVLPTLEMQNGYGWVHCIGTHYHPNDFWVTLQESGAYAVLKKPSIILDKNGNECSVWEWKKSIKELQDTRALVGSIIFNMQYQQEVPKAGGNIFKAEWINYFNSYTVNEKGVEVAYSVEATTDKAKNKEETVSTRKEKVRLYAGVDLAISQKATADSFVIAVIGVGRETGNIYLLDMVRAKLSFQEQITAIKAIADKWKFIERIGVESVAYQQALAGELIRTTQLPIVKIKTVTDKVTRMNKFSAQWENGKVWLYQHIKDLHILETETLNFPEHEHDDTIDAFEIACQVIGKAGGKTGGIKRDMFSF